MKNKHKRKRMAFVGLTFAVSTLALLFVISNFRDNMVFFYAPGELLKTEVLAKTISS